MVTIYAEVKGISSLSNAAKAAAGAFIRAGFCACAIASTTFSGATSGRLPLNGHSAAKAKGGVSYTVRAKGISLRLSRDGQAVGLKLLSESAYEPFDACSGLVGENAIGKPRMIRIGDGVEFTRYSRIGKRYFRVIERFEPSGAGIRWQIEIESKDPAWSAPISTKLKFPNASNKRIWMAWNDPQDNHSRLATGDSETPWNDPLEPQPFRDRALSYGEKPNTVFWTGDVVTLPIVSVLDTNGDRGVSLIQSPDDAIPAAQITCAQAGWFTFDRLNRRLGGGKTVRFTMFLIPHAADPKAALAGFASRFPRIFEPRNPAVAALGGCAAYSGDERNLDAQTTSELRRMDFKTMWKLSDDYAYMGMFIPPVTGPDDRWQRTEDSGSPPNYKPAWTSVRRLNDYARMLKSNGFHLLSYFNVVEFGRDMKAVPKPSDPSAPGNWRDSSQYLQVIAPNAPLRPDGSKPEGAWQGGWALDPGDPGYRAYLLRQADRDIRWLPASEGICIDRLDYLNQYNDLADDGLTFHNGARSRALVSSWQKLMALLGPKLHHAGKVIFANMMDPRLDLAEHLDGVYAEFGNQPTVVNGLSFMCLDKPLLVWTRNEDQLNDAFFQRDLYLGAFPTAPYPTNNHCIEPSPEHDRWYLDYGPLFAALNGRKWVLKGHAIYADGGAKANLFSVPGGFAAVVAFAPGTSWVRVHLGQLPRMTRRSIFEAILPGVAKPVKLAPEISRGRAVVDVPIVRGCAVVKIGIR